MKEVIIDGTTFCVHADHVSEWGTNLRYDPRKDKGYQLANGERVALESFEAFGSDLRIAGQRCDEWCRKARKAWETAHIDNGKKVLRGIVDNIKMRNDTEGWDDAKWDEAVEDELNILHDEDNGIDDLRDLLAYVIDENRNDAEMLADITCYGIANMIGSAMYSAEVLGEECPLLK